MGKVRRGIAGTRIRIRGNMTVPRGARLTGETLPDGRNVLVLKRPVYEKRDKRDADGNILYHVSPDGRRPTKPAREVALVGYVDDEFVQADLGNGIVKKQRTFRPGPIEIEAQRRQEAEKRGLQELGNLATAAAEKGISIADLIASIRSEPEKPADPMAKARAALAAKREAEKNGGGT